MTILELVRRSIARHPERTAVVTGDERVSYRELGRRASRVAAAVRARGVRGEQLVCVAAEPSVWAPVAMLGVLEAGAVYVPLELGFPAARLRDILAQVGSSAPVLATAAGRRVLPRERDVIALDLDTLPPPSDARSPPSADALAYVIFTSGSTGRPKGVMVPHRGLPNLVAAQNAMFAIDEDAVVLQFAPLAVDASISELLTTLAAGATLCMAPRDALAPGPRLVEQIARDGVTVATLPPSSLALLEPADFPSLRTVVSAGEACSAALVARWAPGRRFVNAYGPTEVTVCATMQVCRPAPASPGIGPPLPGTTLRVLDPGLRPVERGQVGELYVAGPGVARGYLARPAMTAERFVPDLATPGARMYRTGDLVRERADGELEFVGRADHQVKLRGHRIELGEIEAVMREVAGVRDAVALAQADERGDVRLVAYALGEGALDRRAIRAALASRLPAHARPQDVVVLPDWPRTPAGKIDRAALPAPIRTGSAAGCARSELEYLLTMMWEDILDVSEIAPDDDFFDLGGHSLLAIRMLTRVRDEIGVDLPLSIVTQQRTLGALAQVIAEQRGVALRLASPLPLRTRGTSAPLYLVPAVSGSALAYLPLLRRLATDRPIHAFHAPGLDGHGAVPERFEDLARHYIGELQAVQPHGPYLLGGWSIGGALALEMALQLAAAGHEVPVVLMLDSSAPNRYLEESMKTKVGEMTNGVLAFMYVNNFARCFGVELGLDRARFAALPDAELEPAALRELRRVPAFPPDMDPARLAAHMAVHAATLRGFARWHPAPRYRGRLVLFVGRDGHPDLTAARYDWSAFVDGSIDTIHVPGTHFSVVNEPHVVGLATELDRVLEQLR